MLVAFAGHKMGVDSKPEERASVNGKEFRQRK